MKDNKYFNIHHNIFLRLIHLERQGGGYRKGEPLPEDIVDDIKREAKAMTDRVYPEYTSRRDAPLWLNRQLKDIKWIEQMTC